MKVVYLVFFVASTICFSSCSSGNQGSLKHEAVSKNEVDSILSAYYSENKNRKKMREFEVKKCTQQDINFYKNDAFYSSKLGEFSECDFALYDYTEPKCSSIRLVVKKCDAGTHCSYKFSETDLGTCD